MQRQLQTDGSVPTFLTWSQSGRWLGMATASGVLVWDRHAVGVDDLMRIGNDSAESVSFTRDAGRLVCSDRERNWRVYRVSTGELLTRGRNVSVAVWSPAEDVLARVTEYQQLEIWEADTEHVRFGVLLPEQAFTVAWSPDGTSLAAGGASGMLRILNPSRNAVRRVLEGASDRVNAISWSPGKGELLAAGGGDRAIRVWSTGSGRLVRVLEGHTAPVASVEFSHDGRVLLSRASDDTVRVWRCDCWEEIAALTMPAVPGTVTLSVNPADSLTAVYNAETRSIHLLALDVDAVLAAPRSASVQYVNAKVVLVGESGVGKSGLGIRIAESRFRTTESTHGAQFWQLDVPPDTVKDAFRTDKDRTVRAELTLWDFAGQPEYHLIHQLFLDDADVALLVYACDRPSDPFRGVLYWAKALKNHLPRHARRFLVAARCDVNPMTVGERHVRAFLSELGLDRHFVTSAKTGEGVEALLREVMAGIRWEELARTTTPKLWEFIRRVLLESKEAGDTLVALHHIHREVNRRYTERVVTGEELDTVISSLQARGFVHRLDSGRTGPQILLRPELINQYGSSIVQAARAHPRALGAVLERDVLRGQLPFTGVARAPAEAEATILEATVELLLQHQLCFRHMGQLVFPSQLNNPRPPLSADHPRSEVSYRFSGSVEAIYASLVVSLSYTNYFELDDCWSYAADFARDGQRLGFSLQQTTPGTGDLDIYFYEGIDKYDRVSFIRYITDHLRRRGIDIKESIRLYCKNPNCLREITDREAIEQRIRDGKTDIVCQYCSSHVEIARSIEQIYDKDESVRSRNKNMNEEAKQGTEEAVRATKRIAQNIAESPQQPLLDQPAAVQANAPVRILHLSDLHFRTQDAGLAASVLETDLHTYFKTRTLDYLILSGDIADTAQPVEYDLAFRFVHDLVNTLGLNPERVVVVPGNHDVNWDVSEDAYKFVNRRRLPPGGPTGRFIDLGAQGILVCDEARYKERFSAFNQHFYRKVCNTHYSLEYEEQFSVLRDADRRVLIVGLNSCWELDHNSPEKAGLHEGALAKVLTQLNSGDHSAWLKIAVWHHPVGPGTMSDAFLGLLARHGFQIGLQGHIHEAKRSVFQFGSSAIHIIGGGTFSAPPKEQVAGIPLQYSLLQYDSGSGTIRIDSRKQEQRGGAWIGDARHGSVDAPKAWLSLRLMPKKARARAAGRR
jgi:small GTP-binding protein